MKKYMRKEEVAVNGALAKLTKTELRVLAWVIVYENDDVQDPFTRKTRFAALDRLCKTPLLYWRGRMPMPRAALDRMIDRQDNIGFWLSIAKGE